MTARFCTLGALMQYTCCPTRYMSRLSVLVLVGTYKCGPSFEMMSLRRCDIVYCWVWGEHPRVRDMFEEHGAELQPHRTYSHSTRSDTDVLWRRC